MKLVLLLFFLTGCSRGFEKPIEEKVPEVDNYEENVYKSAEKTAEELYNEALYYLSKYKESIKAIYLLKEACELDHIDACFRLAKMDVKKKLWYAEKAYRLSGREKEFLEKLRKEAKFESWVDFE